MGSILVVDDDADLSTMLASILTEQGHDVRTAPNGRVALDRVAERMPDLILLDMMMPVMGGQEFAVRFLREYGHATRIVVMTAADSAATRAQELDADGWLSKPFDLDELARVLEESCQNPPPPPGAGG